MQMYGIPRSVYYIDVDDSVKLEALVRLQPNVPLMSVGGFTTAGLKVTSAQYSGYVISDLPTIIKGLRENPSVEFNEQLIIKTDYHSFGASLEGVFSLFEVFEDSITEEDKIRLQPAVEKLVEWCKSTQPIPRTDHDVYYFGRFPEALNREDTWKVLTLAYKIAPFQSAYEPPLAKRRRYHGDDLNETKAEKGEALQNGRIYIQTLHPVDAPDTDHVRHGANQFYVSYGKKSEIHPRRCISFDLDDGFGCYRTQDECDFSELHDAFPVWKRNGYKGYVVQCKNPLDPECKELEAKQAAALTPAEEGRMQALQLFLHSSDSDSSSSWLFSSSEESGTESEVETKAEAEFEIESTESLWSYCQMY